ncbi:hypothetical protein ACFVQB_06090 [Paenibacillus sp. NPDC057886]
MDYELGSEKPNWKYWDAIGDQPARGTADNPIWNEIKASLTK